MTNRLPEKLTTLRKQYGYAQADIAKNLKVELSEYLNWENGNSICTLMQLRNLAELYRVSVQDLMDNRAELPLKPTHKDSDEIDIPFMNHAHTNMSDPSALTMGTSFGQTILPIDQSAIAEEEMDTSPTQTRTRVIERIADQEDLGALAPTTMQEIVEDPTVKQSYPRHEASPKQPKTIKTPKAQPQAKPASKKLKKPLLIGAIVIILLLIVGIFFTLLKPRKEYSVALSPVNRLALGDGALYYIASASQVQTAGDQVASIDTNGWVQVQAFGSTVVGLKNDGSVLTNLQEVSSKVSKWEGIKTIAAGKSHVVGVQEDGTVVCEGDTQACDVSEWTDISRVYAGDGITIGLQQDGKLKTAGTFSSLNKVNSLSDVKDLAIGKEQIAILQQDGTVVMYAIGSKGTSNTATWTQVSNVAIGDSFVAGIKNGKVLLATTDDALQKEVEEWNNVSAIAAYGNTLVAIGADGKILGAGDNSKHIFGTEQEETATPQAQQLATVANAKFTVTAANLGLTWDTVEHADYYMVTVDTDPVTSIKTQKASASITSDKLKDGTTYHVEIVAFSNSEEYGESKPLQLTYAYQASAVKLDAPGNIQASLSGKQLTITWNAVNNAANYEVTIGSIGYNQKTSTNSITIDTTDLPTGTYEVEIFALPQDGQTRYAQSDKAVAKIDYTKPTTPLETPQIKESTIQSNGDWVIKWGGVANADSYTIEIGTDYKQTVKSDTTSITIPADKLKSGTTYLIVLTATPADTATYQASVGKFNTTYTYQKPTPTPTPAAPQNNANNANGGNGDGTQGG